MVEKSDEFIISRVFDAPRERVWKAWTEAERLKQWWGPKGFTVSHCTVDLRPGGVMHYCLRSPDGDDMWGRFVYREIVAPERIVWINSFSDKKGGLVRHPMHTNWPMELLSTLTLAKDEGRTTLTLQWSPLSATGSERDTFDAGHASMQQGWGGTFDQLADYLKKG
jgi:uncharacterized protein YndB with AHSA1/START domain